MAESTLADAVRAFVAKINAGMPNAARDFIAAQFYVHAAGPGELNATDTWVEMLTALLAAMPDLRVDLEELWSSDEKGRISGRATVSGTFTAPLWGAPPSGTVISQTLAFSARQAGDRIAINFDDLPGPQLMALVRRFELLNPPDQMDQPPKHANAIAPDFILRMAFTGQVEDRPCSHLAAIAFWDTEVRTCVQCVALGDIWPSLRLCTVCGFVGCCDTSKNSHMKHHMEQTGHVLIRAVRLSEGWMWCYADNAF